MAIPEHGSPKPWRTPMDPEHRRDIWLALITAFFLSLVIIVLLVVLRIDGNDKQSTERVREAEQTKRIAACVSGGGEWIQNVAREWECRK